MIDLMFLALCGGVAYSGFCRIVHMSQQTTQPVVRHVFVLLPVGAIASMFMVLFGGYHPDWPALIAPANLLAILVVSRKRWITGVPPEYRSAAE